MKREQISRELIAGPCAAESREQVLTSVEQAKKRGITEVRLPIRKPRTKFSWNGIGVNEGIPLLQEVAQMGVTPATEVMDLEDATKVVNGVLKVSNRVDIWLGSRNQNDKIQEAVGRLIAGDERIRLGIKNQPWPDEEHWKGIISHVVEGGHADASQLFLVHRGFFDRPDWRGLRNPPDFDMALRLRAETGIPMLLDPSHIGGAVDKVIVVAQEGMATKRHGVIFDGLMIEIHPDVQNAKTDQRQQLTWDQFDSLIQPTLVFESWSQQLEDSLDEFDDWGD